MVGGIKKGTTANSYSSKYIEQVVREILEEEKITYIKGISGEQLKDSINLNFKNQIQGVYPDGGIIFSKTGEPLLAIECKFNKREGNAIERWFKNYLVLKNVVKVKRYVTFLLGEGFYNDNPPSRALASIASIEKFESNDIYAKNSSNFVQFYRNKNTDNLKDNIRRAIRKELQAIKDEVLRFE